MEPGTSYQTFPDRETRGRWRYRYHAAAIYLEQGANNEKFYTHPQGHRALPAYLMVHNYWFYIIDFCSSVILLSLALLEHPAVTPTQIPVWIHTILELICLFIFSLELGVKMQWLGFKRFVTHKRTILKSFILVVMFVESCVVLIRQRSHFRITRSLRPIFLIDTHFTYNVRRFVRQILLSLPPVMDMLLLLLVFMFLFSVLGYFLFHDLDDQYFGKPDKAFVSLFVLLTTANNPDVMMRSYAKSRWNAAFFIVYLCIELYFIMNLLLAVVYDTFASNEKEKFRKLYLHRREGAQIAFKLLAQSDTPHSEENIKEIKVEHFIGMLAFLDNQSTLRDMYLSFKALNVSKTGRLSLEEFYHIYEVVQLRWKKKVAKVPWYEAFSSCLRVPLSALGWLVRWKFYQYFLYFVEFLCGLWYFAETFLREDPTFHFIEPTGSYLYVSVGFVTFFVADILLKVIGLGLLKYMRSGWNLFDLAVTLLAILGISLHRVNNGLSHFVVLRFLSLFRLLQMKKSYRDIFNTITILVPRFLSAGICLIVIYYFFAILGMEIFGSVKLENCCNGTPVESNYKLADGGLYSQNSFENILISGVTLFDLMVVNNWFIIMEGFRFATGSPAARLFFMIYFIVMMVVLTIVVAFILEGFLFRIQCSRQAGAQDVAQDKGNFLRQIEAGKLEMAFLCTKGRTISETEMKHATLMSQEDEMVFYEGRRWKNRFDFSTELYASEIQKWIGETSPESESPVPGRRYTLVDELVEDIQSD